MKKIKLFSLALVVLASNSIAQAGAKPEFLELKDGRRCADVKKADNVTCYDGQYHPSRDEAREYERQKQRLLSGERADNKNSSGSSEPGRRSVGK